MLITEAVHSHEEGPPFLLICMSEDGTLLHKRTFCNRIEDHLEVFSLACAANGEDLKLICVPEVCLINHTASGAEFESLYPHILQKYEIDAVAYITMELLIRFEIL